MVRQLISNVVSGVKVEEIGKFRSIRKFVNELNKTYGYKRFTDVTVNNVYYVCGCGILIEFQDAEKSMSIVSDMSGKILSCRLSIQGIEAEGILDKFRCSVTQNCLVLE